MEGIKGIILLYFELSLVVCVEVPVTWQTPVKFLVLKTVHSLTGVTGACVTLCVARA